ncbi:SLC13 family permease [Desulfotomaculum sp. 1211_IL3151]|uniref:SLC13 family permease n=1 Tax=Desulfotomaculum sp. 1211_IL3151 TaxID=3084055 RepID=UPI002FD9F898
MKNVPVMGDKPINVAAYLKWFVTIIIPIVILVLPETALYTYQVKMFLFVTTLGILLVAFELMSLMAVSMMFPVGYLVSGLVPMEVAYSAWTMTMPTVVIGGYLLANVLDRIGLLKRIAYWTILRVGGSYYGLLYGVLIAGFVLNTATGGNAWVIMAAFTFGLCKSFDLGKSIDSAIIMLVGAFSAGASCVFLYTPYFMSLMLNAAHTVDSSITLTWLGFLIQMLPYALFIFGFVYMLPKIFKPTKKLPGKEFFATEYQKLGPMSTDEKKGAVVTVFLIAFMLTGSLHHIELDWAFIVIPWMLYLPGFNVGIDDDVKKIDFSMVFFCVACLSIGITSGHLGIGKILAAAIVPILEPLSSSMVLGAIYLVGVILNFLLTPFAILAGFSEPIAQIAAGLNMNPMGALYALYVGLDQIAFPYEYLTYLIFYAFGLIKMVDFIKIMTTKMVLASLLVFFILIPWWKVLGIV